MDLEGKAVENTSSKRKSRSKTAQQLLADNESRDESIVENVVNFPVSIDVSTSSSSGQLHFDAFGLMLQKGSRAKRIRWPFLVGVSLEEDNRIRVISTLREVVSGAVDESKPRPERPSDPREFKAEKFKSLKIKEWLLTPVDPKQAVEWNIACRKAMENVGICTPRQNPFTRSPVSRLDAVKTWRSVEPIFRINDAKLDITVTEYAGHCQEKVRSMQFDHVDRLICVSGDGLLNEMINGIMQRPDWAQVARIPLGVIPAGSGNAVATSMGYPDPIRAALSITRGHLRVLDLMAFFQQRQSVDASSNNDFVLVRYGVEALMWGIIADVDIESEKYRWMGSARFTVATIPRVLNPRQYPGKILYWPADTEPNSPIAVCQLPHRECDQCLPVAKQQDMLESLTSKMNKKAFKKSKKSKRQEEDSNHAYGGRAPGLTPILERTPDLANPNQDLPPGWKIEDGPFVYFVAGNITHISTDVQSNPFSHCSDGAIDIVYAKKFNDRAKMLGIFASELESGKYIRHDEMEHIKAKAFILIPEGKNKGIMDVDGEPLPGQAIAVESHRGVLSFCAADWHVQLADVSQPASPVKQRSESSNRSSKKEKEKQKESD